MIECSKCRSANLIRNARLMDRNADAGDLTRVLYDDPDALFLKCAHRFPLVAQVCGDCKSTELYASDPAALWEASRKTQQC